MRDLVESDFPKTIAVLWGSFDPEQVGSELHFDTLSAYTGYMAGCNAADGWFEASFVENGAYYVNKDGDFVERKGRSTATSPNCRYVIWGEHPEPGERAEVFTLANEQEAEGFQRGVEDMVGWTACHLVPSTDFLPFETLADALVHKDITPAVQQSLTAYAQAQGYDNPNELDGVFVRLSDGAFVREGWDPRDSIENETVAPAAPAPRKSRGP